MVRKERNAYFTPKRRISFRQNLAQLSTWYAPLFALLNMKFSFASSGQFHVYPLLYTRKLFFRKNGHEEASLSFENFNGANYLWGWDRDIEKLFLFSLSLFLVSSHVHRATWSIRCSSKTMTVATITSFIRPALSLFRFYFPFLDYHRTLSSAHSTG